MMTSLNQPGTTRTSGGAIIEDRNDLRQALRSFWAARVVLTAVELDLFDPLVEEPATATGVARAAGTDPRATEIMLDALVGMGLVTKEVGFYRATPFTLQHLATGSPEPLTGSVRHQVHLWRRWSRLTEVVRTGRPASREGEPARAHEDFIRAMEDHKRGQSLEDLLPLDLSGVRRAVDLGGGPGTLAVALARALPEVRVTLVDLPETIAVARRQVPPDLWETRVVPLEADLTTGDDLGSGYDLAILSAVLHAFGPDDCTRMVRRSADCLAPGGWLVVREFVLEEDRTTPPEAALFAVNMLVNTEDGRSYTIGEIAGWMGAAGLEEIRRISAAGGDVVVGQRP